MSAPAAAEPECGDPNCDACAAGICSWCGHEHDDPAHGPEPDHGENSRCDGCPECDELEEDF